MSLLNATIDVSSNEAAARARAAAAELGFSLAEQESSPSSLTFKKGATLFSWGSKLIVNLTPGSGSTTTVSVITSETFAITDWGRGKRAAQRLFSHMGATPVPAA